MWNKLKHNIYVIMDGTDRSNLISLTFNILLSIIILLNVFAVIMETSAELSLKYSLYFEIFEKVSIGIFTVEYLIRIITCTANPEYRGAVLGRLRFMKTPYAVIDLLAIVPFYLPMFITFDMRFIRILRLFRLFRVFKLGRYSSALTTLGRVFMVKKEELMIALFSVFFLLIIASTLMFYIESEHQPDAFSSIPATMWWAIATLTTVGYGDVYPITPAGKILGSVIAVLGIGLFALPAGIFASGFAELFNKKDTVIKCPNCGEEITKKE